MCQKAYGTLFLATLQFHGSGFEFTQGSPKSFRSSSFARRVFCPECGSPLLFAYDGNPGVWVPVGRLIIPRNGLW